MDRDFSRFVEHELPLNAAVIVFPIKTTRMEQKHDFVSESGLPQLIVSFRLSRKYSKLWLTQFEAAFMVMTFMQR